MKVTILPCPPADDLEPLWRDLQDRADGSVFLSWAWIGTLIRAFSPHGQLVRIEQDGEVVGLGFLGSPPAGWFRASLHLNETGRAAEDSLTIEYNGLLSVPRWREEARAAFLEMLHSTAGRREIRLSGLDTRWQAACSAAGLDWRVISGPLTAPVADLQRLDPDDPIKTLSSNSREQIRRSIRHFEEIGPLALTRAGSVSQALAWFEDLGRFHTDSWEVRGKAGAFSPTFERFHSELILRSFDEGIADILRLTAGDETLGYLYNLRWKGQVYAYQSGLRGGEDPRWRPGLVAHVLAMRLYRSEGYETYKYLAGEARYKTSLANRQDQMSWLAAYRPSPVRAIARVARSLRKTVRSRLRS